MGRNITIAISAKDNFSSVITTMRNVNQNFDKDLSGLQAKMDALNKTKMTLKVDTDTARKELLKTEKQFTETRDEAKRLEMEMANAKYENARRNLSIVSKNAKQAEKDMANLGNTVSKTENRAVKVKENVSGLMNTVAASGIMSAIGDVAGNILNTQIGSKYGQEAGIMSSSILTSAAMGAAIGNMFIPIPGVGAAVGAAGGAALGYFQGRSQMYENKDDAFKEYYKGQYDQVQEEQNTTLSSGSEIAAKREGNKISFSTLLGGDKQASKFLNDVTDFASATPFEYDDLTNISKTLLAYGYKQEELIPLLGKVGDTGSALGMSTDDMKNVAISLGRMQSTGKTNLEYINPLLERGVDVWGYLAEASGKTKKEVQEMVSKGLIPGEEAAKSIADHMGADFAGNMEKQSQTYKGLVSTLQDAEGKVDNAMGEGFNETRKQGINNQISFLSGGSGEKMEEAYKQIGEWKASLENLSEEYERDTMNAVMKGSISMKFTGDTRERLEQMHEEYAKLETDESKEAGAKMGALLAEAQAMAQNEYNASEGAQLAIESNRTLAENIKNDAGGEEAYWDAGYTMGQQFSLGLASAISETTIYTDTQAGAQAEEYNRGRGMQSNQPAKTRDPRNPYASLGDITPEKRNEYIQNYRNKNPKSYAYGLNSVPYDNYQATLHQGERVLTANENRNYGKTIPITITGNTFSVRKESDVEEIASKIVNMMKEAYVLSS